MQLIKISGIRLARNHTQVSQNLFDLSPKSGIPLYRALGNDKINMAFVVQHNMGHHRFISGSFASNHSDRITSTGASWDETSGINLVSIYPHNFSLGILSTVLSAIGDSELSFLYMASSNSMLTFILADTNTDAFINMLIKKFGMSDDYVPLEQTDDEQLDLFIKKRYPEIRSTYVEKRIKTYGINLTTDLKLFSAEFSSFDLLARFSDLLASAKIETDKFEYTSAFTDPSDNIHLSFLTKKSIPPANQTIIKSNTLDAELIHFYGPHFGDRHSIVSQAQDCLSSHDIPVLQTGCTGASITLVFSSGNGQKAKKALLDVFDTP